MSHDIKGLEPAAGYWVPYGNGYEMTQSRQIIVDRLRELKKRRFPIVLVHRNYQSGHSLLVGFEQGMLLLDKPVDWPGTESKIRVIYRDRKKLWNHFHTTVVSTSSDTLYVSLPSRFFVLQRRDDYRVETPAGSLTSFRHKKNLLTNIIVRDLSASGMLLASPQPLPFTKGAVLEKIKLTIPLADAPSPATLHCKGGTVVRATMNQRHNHWFLFGIKFRCSTEEEDAIVRYVRQRELELLRKVGDTDG